MAKQYDLGLVRVVAIDDAAPSSTKVYSSEKTQAELDQLSEQYEALGFEKVKLWSGSLSQVGDTITFGENVNNFIFLCSYIGFTPSTPTFVYDNSVRFQSTAFNSTNEIARINFALLEISNGTTAELKHISRMQFDPSSGEVSAGSAGALTTVYGFRLKKS